MGEAFLIWHYCGKSFIDGCRLSKSQGSGGYMPTLHEIGNAGEGYVVEHLKGRGYTIDTGDTHTSGLADIEAHDKKGKMLIKVKSAVTDVPADLSAEEQRQVKSRAAKMGAVAWQAKVVLNTNLDLIGDIRWEQSGLDRISSSFH